MRTNEQAVLWDAAARSRVRYSAATLAERAAACAGCQHARPLDTRDFELLASKAGGEDILRAALSALGLDALCECSRGGSGDDCRLPDGWLIHLENLYLSALHRTAPRYPAIAETDRHTRYQYLYDLEAYVHHTLKNPDGGGEALIGEYAWEKWRQDFIEKASAITGTTYFALLDKRNPGESLAEYLHRLSGQIKDPESRGAFWREFLGDYPVMARRLSAFTQTTVKIRQNLQGLLLDNSERIAAEFFPNGKPCCVTEITPGLSDVHEGGWSAHSITYENGIKLIFKPHEGALEDAWACYLGEACHLAGLPPFKIPKTLGLENGIIQEWIEHEKAADDKAVARYFFRAGFISGLVFSLGGSDFHAENIVAAGDCPVLVDVETIVGYTNGSRTILSNGFFPFLGYGKGLDPGTCALCDMDATHNLPTIDGEVFYEGYAYGDRVREGFTLAYSTLLHNNRRMGELALAFNGLSARIVMRPTMYYQSLMTLMNRPERMKRATDAEGGLFWLARAHSGSAEDIAVYFTQEYNSLKTLEFPKIMTTVGVKGARDFPGGMRELSETDSRMNARRIIVALQNTRLTDGASEESPIPEEIAMLPGDMAALTALCERYARLTRDALQHKADVFSGVHERTRYFYCQERYCVLEGLLGIAIALSASVNIIGAHEPALTAVDACLDAAAAQLSRHSVLGMGPGLADGLGGLVRGLSIIGAHLPDSGAIPMLNNLLSRLIDAGRGIRGNGDASLLYGDAGLLLALSRLPDSMREQAADLTRHVGQWVLPVLREDLRGGYCARGVVRGVDGRLLALAGVRDLVPDAPLDGLYLDAVTDDSSMLTGRAGITLAAMRLREAEHLREASAFSCKTVCANDTFGYGNAGRLYASAICGDPDETAALAQAVHRSLQTAPRPMCRAEETLYPGFFFGDGGILYALLYALSGGSVEPIF